MDSQTIYIIVIASIFLMIINLLALIYSFCGGEYWDNSIEGRHWFLSYYWLKDGYAFNIIGRILILMFLSVVLFPYYLLKGLLWLVTTNKFEKE